MLRYKPISLTASTTLDYKTHGRAWLTLNKADGITVTLPPATGSGAEYKIFVGTTITSSNAIVQVTTTDIIQGAISIATDIAGVTCPTASDSDTITMNGSTKGGIKGSVLVLSDVASGVWAVTGSLVSSSTEATPFSAAVS